MNELELENKTWCHVVTMQLLYLHVGIGYLISYKTRRKVTWLFDNSTAEIKVVGFVNNSGNRL